MKYADIFCLNAFSNSNLSEVFLETENFDLGFGEGPDQPKSDALGALATPSMTVQGISRKLGPVADLANIAANNFDPTTFFKDAKILGGIYLKDIIGTVSALGDKTVPQMISRELNDRVESTFNWETEITGGPTDLLIHNADPIKSNTKLLIHTVMTTPLKIPENASYTASASLNNFKVNLFGFIIIWFEELDFSSEKGQKPDVRVVLRNGTDAVAFGGPLEFVNQLKEIIPSSGFSDPPSLMVTPNGISASYSLNLPTVSVGIFSLSGVSLGAGFNLPFDSNPASVRFNFSERQHPFSLTVSLFGGGGFFAIGISSIGVQEIEAALEFGVGSSH